MLYHQLPQPNDDDDDNDRIAYIRGVRRKDNRTAHPPRRTLTEPVIPAEPGRFKARILSLDPARASGPNRDRFAAIVLDVFDPVLIISGAFFLPVMPTPDQAEFIYAFMNTLDPPVDRLVLDSRGMGIGVTDNLKKLIAEDDKAFARTRVLPFYSQGGNQSRYESLTIKSGDSGRYALVNKSVAIEETENMVLRGLVQLDPELSSDMISEIHRQFDQFMSTEKPSGAVIFESGGTGNDDTIMALVQAICVARHYYSRRINGRLILPPMPEREEYVEEDDE